MRWPAPIDHAYILCDPEKEPERAAYLTSWLRRHAIDPDSYAMGLTCYGSTLSAADAMRAYNPWQNRRPVEQHRNFTSHNLRLAEISLGVNWGSAAQKAVAAGHKVVLFLESDVLFFDTFLDDLATSMKLLEHRPWDFLSLTAGANLRPPRPDASSSTPLPLGWFDHPPYFHTRTTDAMIVRGTMLEKIVSTYFPFAEILDWELNYQLELHKSRSLWLDPPILRQGSGKEYPTTL